MRLHFVGICGTFMAGLANVARQLGFHVTGSDRGCYEPMRSQLAGINISEGYSDTCEKHPADAYIIGNVARRSMPLVESIISSGRQFYSGPDWLARNV
ncbi:MAG: Mur ligase domain-containing protein, partial [Betaproteobacteria bacterium]|nr:Mur ligase domain-containing protein [Betaproteobacteria bacterium]